MCSYIYSFNPNLKAELCLESISIDSGNRDLAFKEILDNEMSDQRRKELDLYRLYVNDGSFKQAFFDTMKRMVSNF